MSSHHLSQQNKQDRIDGITKMLGLNLTQKQMSEELGISVTAVTTFMKRNGLFKPRTERTQQIVSLLLDGLSTKQIAEETGMCTQHINKVKRDCDCMDDGYEMTTKEVAKELGISEKHVRTLEQSALKKLKIYIEKDDVLYEYFL